MCTHLQSISTRQQRQVTLCSAETWLTRRSRTSVVHMSPSVQTIGTRAMDKKDQPNGIWEPPMHSSCLLCTCHRACMRERSAPDR